MSAPSIPNLLSLRSGSGAGRRGRGRGRSRGGGPDRSGIPASDSGLSHDATIQGTDTDAAVSRLSAVELGYLSDPFARLFVQGPATRRLPIINRGTYTRTTAIDMLVDRFLATTNPDRPRQIVSLGAGTDTRCLRLFGSPRGHRNIIYHEIDFPTIIARKQAIIQSAPSIRAVLCTPEPITPTTWRCQTAAASASASNNNNNTLTLHGLDLRTLTPSSPPLPDFLPAAPTLLLSECCLCYLPPAAAASLVEYFFAITASIATTTTTTTTSTTLQQPQPQTQAESEPGPEPEPEPEPEPGLSSCHPSQQQTTTTTTPLALVLYEPIQPSDPFGQTMVANLAARGISLPTLAAYPTAEAQVSRLRGLGFAAGGARCRTVDEIWQTWVSAAERARVDALEGGLDEVEEWRLLAGHYVVAWGWTGGGRQRGGGGGGEGGLDLDLEVDVEGKREGGGRGGGGGGGLREWEW